MVELYVCACVKLCRRGGLLLPETASRHAGLGRGSYPRREPGELCTAQKVRERYRQTNNHTRSTDCVRIRIRCLWWRHHWWRRRWQWRWRPPTKADNGTLCDRRGVQLKMGFSTVPLNPCTSHSPPRVYLGTLGGRQESLLSLNCVYTYGRTSTCTPVPS